MSSAFHLTDVRVSLGGRTILHDLSLDIPAASTTAIVGPNGAGSRRFCARSPDSRSAPAASTGREGHRGTQATGVREGRRASASVPGGTGEPAGHRSRLPRPRPAPTLVRPVVGGR